MTRPRALLYFASTTLSEAFDPKLNALAFYRALLATLVLFSHCFPLGGFGRDPLEVITNGQQTIGIAAVAAFFTLSGFLNARSITTCSSTGRFLWHRFLRVLPGYWICLLVCAFLVAPLAAYIEHGDMLRVFSAPHTSSQHYVVSNVWLLHARSASIPGVLHLRPVSIADVFAHNPFRMVVNGSLWTLPFEAICYIGLVCAWLLARKGSKRWILISLLIAIWSLNVFASVTPKSFIAMFPARGLRALINLLLYFAVGCLCYIWRERIRFSPFLLLLAVASLVLASSFNLFDLIAPFAVPYLFLWLACKTPLSDFGRHGDFSYGIYIYAFPMQQLAALLHLQNRGFGVFFFFSLLSTGIAAVLSFRLIEAPSLRLKRLHPVSVLHQWKSRQQFCPDRTTMVKMMPEN